jgi:hypothetical protein
MTTNNRYVICYPGGSGGTFLASALIAAANYADFFVNTELGHCHDHIFRKYCRNFNHGSTIASFKEELDIIDSMTFLSVTEGHYRNIVAIRQKLFENFGYNNGAQTTFIKISGDPNNSKEILFVASMLRKKVNCFPELSFNEYLIQTTNYIKSWYWIENAYTVPQTITLTLSDIFLGRVSQKLVLSEEAATKIDQCQVKYLNVQKRLHSDLIQLLHE